MRETKISRQEIENEVNKLIADKMFIEQSEIDKDSKLGFDIGADSIDIIGIVVDLELMFHIHIEDETVDKIHCDTPVGKLYDIVDNILNQ